MTGYSMLTAILWCNAFIVMGALLRRRNRFIIRFSMLPVICLVFFSIFRLLCSVELPHTTVVRSTVILPAVIDFCTAPLVVLGSGRTISLAGLLAVIWAGGFVYWILAYCVQSIRLYHQIAAVPGTDNPRIRSALHAVMAASGKKTAVKVITSAEIATPLVTGFFRPVIFLPDTAFSDHELTHILLHEWTHFLHKDTWVKLAMYLILSVFWWNPLIHLLYRDLDHILEIQCDLTLTANFDAAKRIQYLTSITRVIECALTRKIPLNSSPHAAQLISTRCAAQIKQRFHLVLDAEPKKQRRAQSLLICGMILLALGFSYAFVVQPTGFPTIEPGYDDNFFVTPENAYLLTNEDGSYALYVDGKYKLQVQQIQAEPYVSLPIK
ncbi:MAG: M56 family metallopeptidase [Peptococcaceae bacterium]|jgi:beta-lactamase regulating signal transducer with metallopeptidase domain|nr:M56 family metallopeptidase [Peptococcaceae bacterium]